MYSRNLCSLQVDCARKQNRAIRRYAFILYIALTVFVYLYFCVEEASPAYLYSLRSVTRARSMTLPDSKTWLDEYT